MSVKLIYRETFKGVCRKKILHDDLNEYHIKRNLFEFEEGILLQNRKGVFFA